MEDSKWKKFFLTCVQVLGNGGKSNALHSGTWCSWTTFSRLKIDAGYWQAGLPTADELLENGVADGGAWGQPFLYGDISHIIIPREFSWERILPGQYDRGSKQQDID